MGTTPGGGPETSFDKLPPPNKREARLTKISDLLEDYRNAPEEDTATKDRIIGVFEAMFAQAEQTDPDTEFYNKKGLTIELPRLMDLAVRSGKPLSVLFVDGYKVKRVNEQIDYESGTQVILTTANAIKAATRKSDIQARINPEDINDDSITEEDVATRPGGDEFVVILLGSDKYQAIEIARRIQDQVAQLGPQEIPFYRNTFDEDYTVRVGIVEYDSKLHKDHKSLLSDADTAIQLAKHQPIPDVICINTLDPSVGLNGIIAAKGEQLILGV